MAARTRSTRTDTPIAQISSRGSLTLPAEVRRELGIEGGTTFLVQVEAGRIILQPAAVVPIELYTEDRIAEFEANAAMTPEELADVRARWGIDR